MKLTNLQIDSLTKQTIKEITEALNKKEFKKEEALLNNYKKEFTKIDVKIEDLNSKIRDLNGIKQELIKAFNKDFNTNFGNYSFNDTLRNFKIASIKIPSYGEIKDKIIISTITSTDIKEFKQIVEEYVKK
jgi:hypothetical protein